LTAEDSKEDEAPASDQDTDATDEAPAEE
jgi:hypothetical protein